MTRFARYGPPDRYDAPPPAGLCLSVFAIVRDRGRALVGLPAEHPRWIAEWMPSFAHHDPADGSPYDAMRIPSSYLHEGEHPEDAARRTLRDQLGIRRAKLGAPRIVNATSASGWYPGHEHWDLAFVYEVRGVKPAGKLPWWRELGFRKPGELRARDFGWNADVAEEFEVAARR